VKRTRADLLASISGKARDLSRVLMSMRLFPSSWTTGGLEVVEDRAYLPFPAITEAWTLEALSRGARLRRTHRPFRLLGVRAGARSVGAHRSICCRLSGRRRRVLFRWRQA